jgi:hypothetical protein
VAWSSQKAAVTGLVNNQRPTPFIIEKDGKWQLAEKTDPFQSLPFAEPEAENRVFVYKVS